MQPIKSEMNINIFISDAQTDQELRKILEEYPDSLSFSGKITIWQNQEGSGQTDNAVRSKVSSSVTLHCCYTKEDETDWNELRNHLAVLQHGREIDIHDNQNFLAGENTSRESLKRFDAAHIVLLLISKHFFWDNQCWNLMETAMARMEEGILRVVPVRLSSVVDNKSIPIYDLQWLPKDGTPIKSRSNPDEAYTDVVEGVREVIEVLLKERNNVQGCE